MVKRNKTRVQRGAVVMQKIGTVSRVVKVKCFRNQKKIVLYGRVKSTAHLRV